MDEEVNARPEARLEPVVGHEPGRRLWTVTVEIEALVLADSESDAREFAREIVSNEGAPLADCAVARPFRLALPMDWDMESLVYHDGRSDITVREAIALQPNAEIKRPSCREEMPNE